MIHIQNRNDLFDIAEATPPTPAIGEALSTGGAELLGGFDPIPPSQAPGWIIVVTSRRGTVWNIALTLHAHPDRISTWIVERIPWEYWLGSKDRPGIHSGDHPEKYERRKG